MSGSGKAGIFTLCLGLLLCRVASAQEEAAGGPVVFAQQRQKDMVRFVNFRGALEFLYRRENDDIKSREGGSETFSEDRFEERLLLSSQGYIVHPNLVELNLAGTFGLVQDSISGTQSDNQTGTVYEWDVSALILRKEAAPVTLYSRRTRDLINRDFGPSIDNTITQSGGIVDWRNKAVPTRVEVYRQDQSQRSLDSTEDINISQNVANWHSEAKPTANQRITWDYTFTDAQETGPGATLPGVTPGGTLSYQSHDATLAHTYDFGQQKRSNLSSTLHYFNQSGDFGLERLEWTEWLRLRHSESFETRAIYRLNQQTTSAFFGPSSDQTLQRGEVGFTHRLYKSLTTDGMVGFQQVDQSDGFNSTEWFTNLDAVYTKQVPFGRITANLGGGYDQTENSARTAITHVINEVHTFNDPFPIALNIPNIVANSIVITDPSGLVLYRPTGRRPDFTVRSAPGGVQIFRDVGGRIPNNGTVLIDYDLAAEPSNSVDTTQFHAGLRYDIESGLLKGLAVYTRYSQVDQSISASAASAFFIPNSFTDLTSGAEYKRWGFTVGVEQELHDSTISPFDAMRYWGRYEQSLSRDTRIQANTAYTVIDYREPTIHIELLTVSGSISRQFARGLYGSVTVLYRNENDTTIGQTTGWEEQAELRWDHRQFHLFVQFRNSTLDTQPQSSSFQFLQVGIRREF